MVEQIIILILFLAAAFFIGRRIWKAFDSRDGGCAKGCGCATDKAMAGKS